MCQALYQAFSHTAVHLGKLLDLSVPQFPICTNKPNDTNPYSEGSCKEALR